MTSADELKGLLAGVDRPVGPSDVFLVAPLPGDPPYRIGRDSEGSIVLLTPPDPTPDPPTRLRRISMDPRLRCVVETEGRDKVEGDFGVVRLRVGEDELTPAFLDVVLVLIRLIGTSPTDGSVSAAMRRFVQLFDPSTPARGSVLGLWGELFVMARAADGHKLLDYWHPYVDSRFDFAGDDFRLDVKATTRDVRLHEFALEQLLPLPSARVLVLSLMTTETNSGTSVRELVGELESDLANDASRQMTLHHLVAATLGPDWTRSSERCFDVGQAIESAACLDVDSIPRIAAAPPGVTAVRFRADCTEARRVCGLDELIAVLLPVDRVE
ncbi:putative PD-(D/E)XK family protein DUF4420 [Mumia flava]|uniref:Putative PD-(D/E)XK family protein DUF4420 n=1 Tax=Mumia flava TaxID=1348852 RepID=A0A2M9B742_9ACTN|nr:putative PD-(D/E)XK family protein DUF4420 [Mumia flava]